MIVSLTNGTVVPLHWDDRFYVANCPKCEAEVYSKAVIEVKVILDSHC